MRSIKMFAVLPLAVAVASCSDGAAPTAMAAAPPTTLPATSHAFRIEEATIEAIQRAILERQVTTVNVVERYLARIKAYNGTCVKQPNGILGAGVETIPHAGQINALSTLNLRPAARTQWGFDARKARSMTDAADENPAMPDALEVAAEQDAAFARTGELLGPRILKATPVPSSWDPRSRGCPSASTSSVARSMSRRYSRSRRPTRRRRGIVLRRRSSGRSATDSPKGCNVHVTLP
jgi:amidase